MGLQQAIARMFSLEDTRTLKLWFGMVPKERVKTTEIFTAQGLRMVPLSC
jgi:hypothetical protein